MIVLLLGGLISSSVGLVLGFSRVARGVRRLAPVARREPRRRRHHFKRGMPECESVR